MALFCKKIVCNLGNYETLALEVSECSSFLECDKLLEAELGIFGLPHRGVRMLL